MTAKDIALTSLETHTQEVQRQFNFIIQMLQATAQYSTQLPPTYICIEPLLDDTKSLLRENGFSLTYVKFIDVVDKQSAYCISPSGEANLEAEKAFNDNTLGALKPQENYSNVISRKLISPEEETR